MANKEKNKQFRETEERVEAAFLALRQDLPLEKITVSRICQETGLNRSSFYYHYLDVYDLQDQIAAKLNDRLAERMLSQEAFMSRKQLLRYFDHIKDNQAIYRLLSDVKVTFPIAKSYEAFKTYLLEKSRYQTMDEAELELAIIYIQAGFTYMMRHWLVEGCQLPVDQLVDLFLEEVG